MRKRPEERCFNLVKSLPNKQSGLRLYQIKLTIEQIEIHLSIGLPVQGRSWELQRENGLGIGLVEIQILDGPCDLDLERIAAPLSW